ncbi:predicted protein [Histoplasma capsulatum var. duboisii H88]|uniref:Predicted protein n=1 Tax=Ajellomyces capsulatus (strain H88) TaxID=544711 RepID=F0UMK8_AJEC8|nr:predicted protein [Histoplasma capsulatum var. duboisii H88]
MSRIVWDAKHQGLKSEHLTKFHQEFDIFARIVYVKIRTDDLRHRAGKEAATCVGMQGDSLSKAVKTPLHLSRKWYSIANISRRFNRREIPTGNHLHASIPPPPLAGMTSATNALNRGEYTAWVVRSLFAQPNSTRRGETLVPKISCCENSETSGLVKNEWRKGLGGRSSKSTPEP